MQVQIQGVWYWNVFFEITCATKLLNMLTCNYGFYRLDIKSVGYKVDGELIQQFLSLMDPCQCLHTRFVLIRITGSQFTRYYMILYSYLTISKQTKNIRGGSLEL